MDLRISKAAAALFLSSFFFSACDDPTAIGLELQEPGTQIGTTFSDTASIKVSTILLKDSIITLGSSRAMVGTHSDDAFGSVTSKALVEFGIPTGNVTFEPNLGADSLVLRLDYDYYFGDTTKAVTWNVYKLTEGFSDTETYYTTGPTSEMTYDPAVLGTVTFTPLPYSTYVTTDLTGDTLTENNPYLAKIKLVSPAGMELANAILAQSGKDPLKTQQGFVRNLLKGLVIAPAPGEQNKAILGLNLSSPNTVLTLYYTSTTDNKQKSYTFIPSVRYFNKIEADRTGTPLAGLTEHGNTLSSSAAGNLAYLQAGAGLVTRLELPYITNYRKNQSGDTRDLAINKAELVIPLLESTVIGHTNEKTLPPHLPPVVTVLESTKSGYIPRTQGIPNAILGEGTGAEARLEYRGKGKGYNYVVNITSYMQNLLYSKRPNNGLLLYPSNITSNPATPTTFAQTVNRAIIEANQNSTNSTDRRIKLRLFYSTAQ